MNAMEQPHGGASAIAEMIRAKRLEMNLSQAELAQKIGSHAQTIHKIEAGIIKYSRYFDTIGRVLNLELADTWAGRSMPPLNPELRAQPGWASGTGALFGPGTILVHSAMPHERDARLTMLSTRTVGRTNALQCLQHVANAYAFPIVTSAMAPAFEIGDEVQVHPFLPPEPGRDVVLYSKAAPVGDTKAVCVARLIDIGAKSWTLAQWSGASERKLRPFKPHEFTLSRADYSRAHIIVGKKMRWNS